MYATSVSWCDFVVWTLKDMKVIRVLVKIGDQQTFPSWLTSISTSSFLLVTRKSEQSNIPSNVNIRFCLIFLSAIYIIYTMNVDTTVHIDLFSHQFSPTVHFPIHGEREGTRRVGFVGVKTM